MGERKKKPGQAEHTLKLTQFVIDRASFGCFWIERDSRIIYANDQACLSLGYSREELLRMSVKDIDPEFPAEAWPEFWMQLLNTQVQTFETVHRRKDGTRFPVEITANYMEFDGKQYSCAYVRDLTERKRAEEALRQSEAHLEEAQRIAHVGSWEWDAATDIPIWSKELCVILEVDPANPPPSLKEQEKIYSPESMKRMHAAMERAMQTGAPYEIELERVREDGTSNWLLAHGEVRFDENGKIIGLHGTALDINERKQAERELRESEERLRQAVRVSEIGIFDHDHLRSTIYWSARQREIHGWGPDEPVTLKDFINLVHPEDLGWIDATVKRAHDPAGDGFWDVEHRIIRRDGSIRWLRARSQTFFTGEGSARHPVRTVGAVRDITEDKQSEAKINHLTRLYAFLSQVNQAIVRTRDRVELFHAVCRVAVEFGRFRMAWIGLFDETIGEVQPLAYAGHEDGYLQRIFVASADAPLEKGLRTDVFREGGVIVCDDIATDPRMQPWREDALKRGYVSMAVAPFRKKGAVIGLLNLYASEQGFFAEDERKLLEEIAQDISYALDAMEAEKELLESEERFRSIFEGAMDGIIVSDASNRNILMGNKAFCDLLGCTQDELRILKIDDLHPADALQRVTKHIEDVASGGVSIVQEMPVRRRDGTIVYADIGAAVLDFGGKAHLVGFFRDTTERKQAWEEREKLQAQLTQAQKMESIGRLAGGVAHDFNNMLGVILGHAELALHHLDPASPLHAHLRQIETAANRSADITRQLLAFARKQTIAPKVLDLNETTEGMLKMMRRLLGEDIDMAWVPGRSLWPVKIDPAQVNQILANLLVNARDAIIREGRVTIETENVEFDEAYCAENQGFMPGKFVLLAVSDNGIGMDRETLSSIFEPFFTTKDQGTGLGLAMVYGMVKQNDGFISVYSEPGKGTTFKIHLPGYAAEAAPGPTEPSVQKATGGTETILLVEDDLMLLQLTKTVLEEKGYSVLPASTPGEAIRLAKEHAGKIHLLITDVVMPEMNGRELTERLLPLSPNLKCLFMSGYTADVIAHRGVLEEGVHFLQKPFSIHNLAAKVREALK
jgi:PAS domain S-box-containing protein